MYALIRNFCLTLLLVHSLGATDQVNSAPAPTHLRIGISADYPPFAYTIRGEIVGYDVDLIKALAQKMNFSFELKDMNFCSLMLALDQGDVDCVISEVTITDKRKQRVDFSTPYYTSRLALLYTKDKPVDPQQLENKKLGAQLGSTMDIWIKDWVKANPQSGTEVVSIEKNPQLVELLKAGQLDAVILEEVQALSFQKQHAELQVISMDVDAGSYGIVFKKDSPLRPQFDTALSALKEDGTLQKLQDKWIR